MGVRGVQCVIFFYIRDFDTTPHILSTVPRCQREIPKLTHPPTNNSYENNSLHLLS